MSYLTEQWHDLFTMTGGAAAALAGLIFVAVSLNHEQILRSLLLPPLAAQTLTLLIGLVLQSALVLTPAQSGHAFGVEVLGLGAVIAVIVLISTVRTPSEGSRTSWRLSRLGLGIGATLPAVIGGISLILGAGGGLYWLLAGVFTTLVVAVYYAWILLIEIRR